MKQSAIYIQSLQASDIYSHQYRGKNISSDYVGAIPFSLESIKLREVLKRNKLKIKKVKTSEKQISDDVINVKFEQSVVSGDKLIILLQNKVNRLEKKLKEDKEKFELDKKDKKISSKKMKNKQSKFDKRFAYIENLKAIINNTENELENNRLHKKWQEVKVTELRKQLYENGFTIRNIDEKSGEIIDTDYIVYKRSSAKSRVGECLFINKKIHEEMIWWSRMYLEFDEDKKMDMASLLAYESLVGSSIEDTLTIDTSRILIVEDIDSTFEWRANVVKKNEDTGFLDSFPVDNAEVKNSLFDGEGLLQSGDQYFSEGYSMKLLRNHMFKSAVFACDIRQFLQDNCPKGIPFDEWEITNMFNQKINAKDVDMIITPSSLKALKFSYVFEGKDAKEQQRKMWNYWKKLCKKEGSSFGVCKHEKASKLGTDDNGKILQQTSYQMLNSMQMKKADVLKLAEFEKQYIQDLKNDKDFFINYLKENATEQNSHEMFAAAYERNNGIFDTKIFRDYKKKEIHKYVKHVKGGKLRLVGDYAVMLGNPIELLKHSIGKFDASVMTLQGNQVYTKLHDFGKTLVGFRNPHTSQSNVLQVVNTDNDLIKKYFKDLSPNIVIVNAWNFPIQDILSGADYDSDTIVLFENEKLTELSNYCYGAYNVCINKVSSKPKLYKLNNSSMYEIDVALSESQKNIGQTVNQGQLCMSLYWDLFWKSDDKNNSKLKQLQKYSDVMTVLSGIAIDMAKKMYDIDLGNEIKHVAESLSLKTVEVKGGKVVKAKPNFWKYVEDEKEVKRQRDKAKKEGKEHKKKTLTHYNTPMDLLIEGLSIERADAGEDLIEFKKLLDQKNITKGDRHQEENILRYVEEMVDKIGEVKCKLKDEQEQESKISDIVKYCNFFIEKKTVKEDTMYAILTHMFKDDFPHKVKLLNTLYRTQREVFLNAFKNR